MCASNNRFFNDKYLLSAVTLLVGRDELVTFIITPTSPTPIVLYINNSL